MATRIKAGEHEYEVGELTLGEFRLLKKLFGVERMDLLDPRDPDHIVGYLTVAELRRNPKRDLDEVVREFEALTTIEIVGDEDEDESDPTEAASEPQSSASESPEPADEPGGSS